VFAIHHQVRNLPRALEYVGGEYEKLPKFKTNSPTVPPVDGYAINAHTDYSDVTAPRTAREQLHRLGSQKERRRHARGRFVMINAWRNPSKLMQASQRVSDKTNTFQFKSIHATPNRCILLHYS